MAGKMEEDIVMTASKVEGRARIHLERKLKKDIDPKRVHHIAGGPYKGIFVNKTAEDLGSVEPAEGRLEFLAYLADQDHYNSNIQELWTIRFWFRGQADRLTKKQTFTDYFEELMNPQNFPKNYIGLVKRALVLLQKYTLIKRVELEVTKTAEPEPDDPIRSFVTILTPQSYNYQQVPEIKMDDKTWLTFMVKAGGDGHIALSAVYGDIERKTYEIHIGADGNTKSYIRDGGQGIVRAESKTLNILDRDELRYFWVSWADHHIEVGRGAQYGYGRFLHWEVPEKRRFQVNCLSVSTGLASEGRWEFAEILKEFRRSVRKNNARVSLLWLAKKQRMLQTIEDAYPNSLSASEVLKQSKIKQSDMMTAAVMLQELEKKSLIKEVATGIWMRTPQEADDTQHKIEVVKQVPILSSYEQPTIAIITALYCEKIAVDAMLDNKKTFVKFKSEGESQVYTLGKIGRHKVVSTKLSRYGSMQAAMIAAENTVTRLLGIFNRVDHVLLVGVGGAVPHYSDHTKHCRLGDVVVSMPVDRSGSIYVYCQKVEKIPDHIGFSYVTRGYGCNDTTLQKVVEKLKTKVARDTYSRPPWDTYLESGKELLKGEESSFHRPALKSDKLFYTKPGGEVIQVEHPKALGLEARRHKEGTMTVHSGLIGAGRMVVKSDEMRREFAQMNNIQAFDVEFDYVLESLEGNRNESYLIIRGMADYVDGNKKDWQSYAALCAAAYMKALILAI